MIGSLGIFRALFRVMNDPILDFLLSLAVIQFLECSYLFRLDNQIGMSLYKLSQYHHAVAISKGSI